MAKPKGTPNVLPWNPPAEPVVALVSGGLDSTVLAHLLAEVGLLAGMYHANYGLRGADLKHRLYLTQDFFDRCLKP